MVVQTKLYYTVFCITVNSLITRLLRLVFAIVISSIKQLVRCTRASSRQVDNEHQKVLMNCLAFFDPGKMFCVSSSYQRANA